MSVYQFHLGDRVLSSNPGFWGEGTAYAIGEYLKEFFDQVCHSPHTSYASSDYHWNTPAANIGTDEVLIYFVNRKADSLIRQQHANHVLGGGGTTRIHSVEGNLSEVYVTESLAAMGGNVDRARGLAVLAFHEAMHNKLKKGNSLHATGGGGMASATVFPNTQLSAKNIELMAKALDRAVLQNTQFLAGLPQSTADLW